MAQPPVMPPAPPQGYQAPPQGYQFQPQPPAPPVSWYHEKWFVVLMLIFFFPIGLVLLWTSPKTKLVGRLVWTVLIALAAISGFSGSDTPKDQAAADKAAQQSPAPASAPVTTPVAQTPAPASPPKEEYNFTVTNKDTGKIYKGKTVSNVGGAVIDVKTATTIGNDMFNQKASPGAVFVLVHVYMKNDQNDAITLDGSLFKLLHDGKEYSYSTEGSTALELSNQTESLFLKKVNPGLSAQGLIPFEVPESIDLEKAQFQFRGGFTGKAATVPVKPVTE